MSPTPAIHPDLKALFEFTRAQVIRDDKTYNEPNDPRAWDDAELWDDLLRTGRIPGEEEYEFAEVICLTAWYDAEGSENPERFKAFRRFTCSVALIFLQKGNTHGDTFPAPNYPALNLLRDLPSGDGLMLELLRGALAAAGAMLKEVGTSAEYPFFVFGELVIAQTARDWTAASQAAIRLLAEEDALLREDVPMVPEDEKVEFLFHLTSFDRFEKEWRVLAARLQNPENDSSIARVMDLFAGASR